MNIKQYPHLSSCLSLHIVHPLEDLLLRSFIVFNFGMLDLQQTIPVLSMFRHFQCNHGVSDPGPRSSDGMDFSFCGTGRRWWAHTLSRPVGGFVSSGVTEYLLTSGVCLHARDCIGNAWDLLSAFFFLVEMW